MEKNNSDSQRVFIPRASMVEAGCFDPRFHFDWATILVIELAFQDALTLGRNKITFFLGYLSEHQSTVKSQYAVLVVSVASGELNFTKYYSIKT